MIVTIFPEKENVVDAKYSTVDKVLESIRLCSLQKQIDEIRLEPDKERRGFLKGKLPNICFSGKIIKRRTDANLKEHSGIVVLDKDHIGTTEQVEKEKIEVSRLPYVYACFVSPSGDGLKVLVRIPPNIKDHRAHYRALMQIFPQLDTTSINESRVCYGSVDENIYINKDAVEFTEKIEKETKKTVYPTYEPSKNTDYVKINIAAKMIREAPDGEKHAVLLKAARLMGGYIAGGSVIESDASYTLESEISRRDISDIEGAKKTIRDGIAYGKTQPIAELERETFIQPKSNGIKTIDSVWENMKDGFINGKKRGLTTYFENFNTNFTWKAGEVTLIVGRPNSGKTEFMLQLMLIRSVFDKWKWGVFSPENAPEEEFYDSLIHSFIGKTTDPFFKNYQMSMTEYRRGYEFIREHFFYVYPDALHTIDEIQSNFLYLLHDKKINGTFIDPFNKIFIEEFSPRDDQFLQIFLAERKIFASKYQTHDIISSHPKIMGKNKSGEYDVVDIYDIAGGAMWSNAVDNIISVHRPNYCANPKDTSVEIHVKKIKKQKLVGVPGMCLFDFSRSTNRYYQDGKNPLDNNISKQAELKIPPNERIGEPRSIEDMPDYMPF